MCIKVHVRKLVEKSLEGYKVVRYRKGIDYLEPELEPGTYIGPYSQTKVVRGKWMKSEYQPNRKDVSQDPAAKQGFNIFRDKKEAEKFCAFLGEYVEKVAFKGLCSFGLAGTCFGDPSPAIAVLADEIYFYPNKSKGESK
jgi:hypothetical protein